MLAERFTCYIQELGIPMDRLHDGVRHDVRFEWLNSLDGDYPRECCLSRVVKLVVVFLRPAVASASVH